MFDTFTVVVVIATFLLAGTVKGVIGLGLPTVSLALLTVAIGLSRDMLVQAMGMLFTVSTVALAFALHRNDLLTAELGTLSAAALLPAIAGMVVGQRIRERLSEGLFRRVFFVSLLVLGAYIIANALGGSVQGLLRTTDGGTKTARVHHERHLSIA